MRLLLIAPKVAARSCADCHLFQYDDNGDLRRYSNGEVRRRPAGQMPPCFKCPKIPPGDKPVPSSAVELSDRNQRAYEHYQECRAVVSFPDDPIVRRNARLIREVEDAVREQRLGAKLDLIQTTLMALLRR